ncbi:MAG: hypothetical protein Homavirus19_10 [Homavirus sp.]|uniref:Uncharacterized protein n=1 Tax=Homavirus sp. TaxID=2487769 RepID=A0A3G5A7Q0_9VIRU|nr:MAG: hypothetical protein Homavirus19_10 [Homavirus sp.]
MLKIECYIIYEYLISIQCNIDNMSYKYTSPTYKHTELSHIPHNYPFDTVTDTITDTLTRDEIDKEEFNHKLLMILCHTIPTITFSSLAYIIGFMYLVYGNAVTTCDDPKNTIMRISTWLITYGSVEFAALFIAILLMIMIKFVTTIFNHKIFLICATTIYLLWNSSWLMVGWFVLFRYSITCTNLAPLLWFSALSVWIWQGLYIIITGATTISCIRYNQRQYT